MDFKKFSLAPPNNPAHRKDLIEQAMVEQQKYPYLSLTDILKSLIIAEKRKYAKT